MTEFTLMPVDPLLQIVYARRGRYIGRNIEMNLAIFLHLYIGSHFVHEACR
jgi:hypothetical protein